MGSAVPTIGAVVGFFASGGNPAGAYAGYEAGNLLVGNKTTTEKALSGDKGALLTVAAMAAGYPGSPVLTTGAALSGMAAGTAYSTYEEAKVAEQEQADASAAALSAQAAQKIASDKAQADAASQAKIAADKITADKAAADAEAEKKATLLTRRRAKSTNIATSPRGLLGQAPVQLKTLLGQ